MKNIFLRILFLFLIIFFQLSFLNILFPKLVVPLLPLTAVVAWTLVSGFPKNLRMTVPLILFYDILTSTGVSSLSLYAVVLAYLTSFLSRRILVERQGFGLLLYGIFSAGGVLGYQLLGLFRLTLPEEAFPLAELLPSLPLSFSSLLLSSLLACFLFMGVYGLVRYFEKYLEQSSQRQFSEVK